MTDIQYSKFIYKLALVLMGVIILVLLFKWKCSNIFTFNDANLPPKPAIQPTEIQKIKIDSAVFYFQRKSDSLQTLLNISKEDSKYWRSGLNKLQSQYGSLDSQIIKSISKIDTEKGRSEIISELNQRISDFKNKKFEIDNSFEHNISSLNNSLFYCQEQHRADSAAYEYFKNGWDSCRKDLSGMIGYSNKIEKKIKRIQPYGGFDVLGSIYNEGVFPHRFQIGGKINLGIITPGGTMIGVGFGKIRSGNIYSITFNRVLK